MGKGSGTCDRPAMTMSASGGYTASQLRDYFSIEAKPRATSWMAGQGGIRLRQEVDTWSQTEKKWYISLTTMKLMHAKKGIADQERLQQLKNSAYPTIETAKEAITELGEIFDIPVFPFKRCEAYYWVSPRRHRWEVRNTGGVWTARCPGPFALEANYQRMKIYSGDDLGECLSDHDALSQMEFPTRQAAYDNLLAWLEYVGYNPES